jgi:MFS family permease
VSLSAAEAQLVDRVLGPEPRQRPWQWTVAVLALSHAAAVASFQILNILVEPIKAALSVTDTQYSLMQGLAVAVFASVLGLPAASLADRGNRRRVILTGAITWSGATVACGLAQNSVELFASRMLVGVGEVFLYPAALSLIADVAPPKRLASAIGAFGCGGPIGTAFALIGGGWLTRHWQDAASSLSWLPHSAWRTGFLMCGVLGLLAVALLLTTQEPSHPHSSGNLGKGLSMTVLHLRRHWQSFLGVSGGMLALSFCVFATSSWSPTMLVRVHGMSYAAAGSITGFAALIGGVVGAWLVGCLTDRVEATGHRDAVLRVSIGVGACMLVTMIAAVFVRSADLAAAFVWITYSLLGMPTVLGGTALQQISPPELRAQVMAIQVLLVNLLALSLGPLTVAVLTEHVFGRPAAVGYSLAWTDGLGAVAAIMAFIACRQRFVDHRRRHAEDPSRSFDCG